MDVRDEIKARLPIEQLVAQYCQLSKKGRNFVCVCPFHNDTHPSFVVSPDKGIGWCFACNSGGDIFSFVQKIEGIDFPAALTLLADKAGVVVPDMKPHAVVQKEKDEKERVRSVLQDASTLYQSQLLATPLALEYVTRRGITEDALKTFQIGFAPDSFSATYEHLLKAGHSKSDILLAGLAIQKDLADQHVYDRFRCRIMIPILDVQGAIIAFGGRTLKKDEEAKYINSPENPLYHKSSILFGVHHAKEAMRTQRKVFLVEGYFDAMAAHKAGVHNVVAVCGTALTDQHIKLLKRYCDTVVLCLDQDPAGKQAAERAFQLLSKESVSVQSLQIPAKDPDELVQRDATMFARLAQEYAVPYIDAVIDQLAELPDVREPSGRRAIADRLFPLLQALPSSVELRAYVEKASQRLAMVENEFFADLRNWTSAQKRLGPKVTTAAPVVGAAPFDAYRLCLGIALQYPSVRAQLINCIPADDALWDSLRDALIAAPLEQPAQDILALLACDESFREQANILMLYCDENFGLWSPSLAEREMRKLCTSANQETIRRKQAAIILKMREARQAGSPTDEALLLNQYQQVLKLAKMAG